MHDPRFPFLAPKTKYVASWLLAGCTAVLLPVPLRSAVAQDRSAAAAPSGATVAAPGTPFTPQTLAALLPPSVYFQGKTASVQQRNAGGTSFGPNATVWAALVDTSGYASDVQSRYQFYLVTEAPLRFGDARIPAGAYGGGFLNEAFVLMDLGGRVIAQGPVQNDAGLRRPRPLEVVASSAQSVRLYLGRRWVLLSSAPSATP